MRPQFGEAAYISEVNRAKKVISDALVATNKNSDPVQKLFPWGGWGGWCPNSNFSKLSELSETSRARNLIFGLQVNIDKASSR